MTFPEIGPLRPWTWKVGSLLEFDKFFVTQVYTPNAGDGLKRLEERQVWDVKYAEYLVELDKEKPVLATGDYNVAHKEIDLANPASNRRSPGFTDEERRRILQIFWPKGFTDTFRHVHGDVPERYTWWAQRSKTSKSTIQAGESTIG